MRIAVVSDAISPWHVGGKEARYRELVRRWEDSGAVVTVYSMRWWGDGELDGHRGLMPKMKLYKQDGKRSTLQALCFSVACLRLLFAKADVIEADHMPGPQLLTLAAVARVKRVPLVVTWHEYWGLENWRRYIGKAGLVGHLVEKAGALLATKIVAVSEQTLTRLLESGVPGEKLYLIPNGTTQPSSLPTAHNERSGMVSFGRLIEHKRVDVAIKVLANLRKMGVDTKLTVIGDGPERGKLETLARELRVVEHVEFLGVLEEQKDVWEIVGRSAVCIMPSEREGYGIAVAEALALGTPVVVGDGTENAARLLVEDGVNGRVVASGSVEEFSEGTLAALEYDNHDVRESFIQEHGWCGWDEAARLQLEVYENLLKKGGSK